MSLRNKYCDWWSFFLLNYLEEQTAGMKSVPVHDPVVEEAAEHAIKTIQQRSNSLLPYELQEIVHANAEVCPCFMLVFLTTSHWVVMWVTCHMISVVKLYFLWGRFNLRTIKYWSEHPCPCCIPYSWSNHCICFLIDGWWFYKASFAHQNQQGREGREVQSSSTAQ